MAATRLTSGSQREIVPAEVLSEVADEMIALARKAGRDLRSRSKGKVYITKPGMPSVGDDAFKADLVEALEDEFIPAVETTDDRIQPSDLEHELIKKALVSLKLKGLRQIAQREDLRKSGSLEDLAVAIARKYQWDEAAIARLVLENEPEPDAARSFVTRMYPLGEEPDLEHALHRIETVVGRYIRIGIARWFVFDDVAATEEGFDLVGTYKAFAAHITDSGDVPSVEKITGRDGQVTVTVRNKRVVEMSGANSVEAHAARAALEAATNIEFRGYLPVFQLDGAIDISTESLLMIDLITTRFKRAGFDARDLTGVRFRVTDTDESGEDEPARPTLRAVKFEGSHLLDSPPACALVTEEGRPLVDVTMSLQSRPRSDGEVGRFPVRITFLRDHVSVMTGFGTVPSLSKDVHSTVVAAVEEMLQRGYADRDALRDLIDRMRRRADEAGADLVADMFGDSYNPADDD